MATEEEKRSYLARQLATMALSHIAVPNPMAIIRAVSWANLLSRLGLHVPLFVVHDLGILFTTPKGPTGWSIAPRRSALARVQPPPPVARGLERYAQLLERIAESEVVERVAGWRLRDELVAVLLTRALGDTYNRWREPTKAVGSKEMPPRFWHVQRLRPG